MQFFKAIAVLLMKIYSPNDNAETQCMTLHCVLSKQVLTSRLPDLCDVIEAGVGRVEEIALLQLGLIQGPHPLPALETWLYATR